MERKKEGIGIVFAVAALGMTIGGCKQSEMQPPQQEVTQPATQESSTPGTTPQPAAPAEQTPKK